MQLERTVKNAHSDPDGETYNRLKPAQQHPDKGQHPRDAQVEGK